MNRFIFTQVIRSGRSFSVEEVNDVRAPLLTVLPARVKTNESADVLRSVQDNIGGVLAYESVSLGRVQAWLQPGRPLFEVLFSISIDDQDEDTSMWKMKESVQPQADVRPLFLFYTVLAVKRYGTDKHFLFDIVYTRRRSCYR